MQGNISNRLIAALAALSLTATVLIAQMAAPAGQVPAGWRFREDKSTNASDPDADGSIKILNSGSGYHIETPTAAVFWHPNNTATGNYTLKGTFTLNERSGHVNFYGLVFGGSNLDAANQKYHYFLVAQDNPAPARGNPQPLGSWLIRTRDGEATSAPYTITGAMGRSSTIASADVAIPGPDGKSVNTLEVRVKTDTVDFVVNGKVVHTGARSALTTDGIWGIRSNHFLNINVDGLSVTKM